jgi:tyrosyl-tRNA synthetase
MAPQCGLTMPLLEGWDGVNKMSKSLGNYIGINEPADEIFGKVMSTSDELMVRYYELLSDMPLFDLEKLKTGLKDGSVHPMEAKKALGREIVSRYHGAAAGKDAEENFVKRFRDNEIPEDMPQVSYSLSDGAVLLAKAMTDAGLTKSNGEGRRSHRSRWGKAEWREGLQYQPGTGGWRRIYCADRQTQVCQDRSKLNILKHQRQLYSDQIRSIRIKNGY